MSDSVGDELRSKMFALTAVMLLMVSAGIAMTPTAMGADLPGVPTSIEVGQQYSVNLLNYLPGTITSANIPT
ncbi:MAG TPA: hypothetical protein PLF76_06475, partial [Methanomassiliicoccaceae archaeon]|nr:hypothetical protein [Methanomassiliicoccaceae archaeon]